MRSRHVPATALATALILGLALTAPAAASTTTVYVDQLQASWAYPAGHPVWSAYYGPDDGYDPVSPGATAEYDGREAGIIKAGLAADPVSLVFEDEGLFAFQPNVALETFAAGPLNYDVVNQSGANPVWITIEIDTGVEGVRADNTAYQFVPTSNAAGWHNVDAAPASWLQWTTPGSGIPTGDPVTLSGIASAFPGVQVVRTYLRLGMGDSYGIPTPTIGWVDKVTIGDVVYDFVLPDTTPPTITITTPPLYADYALNQVVTSVFSCDDVGWGVESCVGPATVDTSSVGSGKTFTVTATDKAGNTFTLTRNYSVHYVVDGFFPPIDMAEVNIAKAGQTIPVKWRVTDASGVGVSDPSSFFALQLVPTNPMYCRYAPSDAIETYVSSAQGNLQYLGDGYWQYNLRQPKGATGCYDLVLALNHLGDRPSALFNFTR